MKDAEIGDNNNNYEEEDEKEKVIVWIEFTEQKSYPQNDENAIEFRRSDIRGEDEKDNTKANLIESLQKKVNKENFPKRVTKGLFDYYGIVPKEKKIVNSNF